MKRPVFIIIGSLLVFVLLGIWIYILFFGSQATDETFTDLNFGNNSDGEYITDDSDGLPIIDISSPDRLRQITTKPTIGHGEIKSSDNSTPEIAYIEAGTGHIFSIDINSGEEKRISGTTIPLSTAGEITPNGQFVMIKSGSGSASKFTIGKLSTTSDEMTNLKLDEKIIDFKSTTDNNFLYAVQTNNSVIAKEYNPIKNVSRTLFTIPFREARIEWGSIASDTHLVYPKTSSKLEGFLYQVTNSKIKRLPIDGLGLSARSIADSVIYSKQVNGKYQTFFYKNETGVSTQSPINIIPEKCISFNQSETKAICSSSVVEFDENIPDSWYQGVTTYSDNIWGIDTSLYGSELLSKTLEESGRELDIINPKINSNDSRFYFINKNDNTLWMFNLVPTLTNN